MKYVDYDGKEPHSWPLEGEGGLILKNGITRATDNRNCKTEI